jgi:integrase
VTHLSTQSADDRLKAAIESAFAVAQTQDDLRRAPIERAAGANLVGRPDADALFSRRKASLPPGPARRGASSGLRDARTVLRPERLREDIRVVAWPIVVAEAEAGHAARSRLESFVAAGRLLEADVPDVRRATLPAVQAAWVRRSLKGQRARQARDGTRMLFDALATEAIEDESLDALELARCAEWVRALRVRGEQMERGERALSAAESDALVAACLRVIVEARGSARSDLVGRSTHPTARDSAYPVVRWGYALIVLLARFTGLRTESLVSVRLEDLYEIGPATYALAWSHGKKRESRVAVVPASVAFLLRDYATATADVRAAVGTDRLFLQAGRGGTWAVARTGLSNRISLFIRSVCPTLEMDASSIQVLRRTFATRALAEGRSIYAVAAQLGHEALATTLRYTKWDRAEHAVEVRDALDRFGRVVLDRWSRPRLTDDLSADERIALEADRDAVDCEVGLCAAGACVMVLAPQGPPPCQACAHLVVDESFFPAWDRDIDRRRLRIAHLSSDLTLGTVAAAEAAQLAEIESIYADLRGGVR